MMPHILQDFLEKINSRIERLRPLIDNQAHFTAALLILVAAASFGLGRQSMANRTSDVPAEAAAAVITSVSPPPKQTKAIETSTTSQIRYVASRNGSVYHLLTCPGAKQISEANKIYFDSKEAAAAAGYKPAANCKGI